MKKLEEVKRLAKLYDERKKSKAIKSDSNQRLTKLVEKHGYELVSAASGLKASSIVQFTSRKTAPLVSEATITKAETVLSQI